MNNVRITIKPMGTAALGLIAVIAVTLALSKQLPRPDAGNALTASASDKANPTPQADIYDDDNERKEAVLMSELNNTPGQKRDWLFLGPLACGSTALNAPNPDDPKSQMAQILSTAYLPDEAKYQAKENVTVSVDGQAYTWRKFNGSAFDFKKLYVNPGMPASRLRNVVVYGVTYVESPEAAKKLVRLRSDDGAVIWLNGTKVYDKADIRGVRDEDTFPVELRKGRNTFLVKVGQWGGGWGLMFHLDDAS